MSFYNFVVKNTIMPLTDFFTGYSLYSSFKLFEKSQFWEEELIEKYQIDMLKKMLNQAKNTKYYRDLFTKIGMNIEDIKSKEDLRNIPILKKKVIKELGTEYFINRLIKKNQILKSSSSGSTGEPLFYLSTKESYSKNIAANIRGWNWMNFNIGDKFIKLSQNPRKDFFKILQDLITRNYYFSISPISEERFNIIIEAISNYKPKFIRCYSDPLFLMAKYIKNNNIHLPKIEAINTTGNTLTEEIRKEIEDVFNCKVYDSYSCEGTPTIFECKSHTHYHIADEYGIVEILNDNDEPISEGIGRLVSTDLWNYVHPFIRYETQDLVEISNEKCEYGIKLRTINRIIGRNNDIIKLLNGKYLIVHNFTGFFQTDYPELKNSILKFQVVKRGNNLIFNLIVNNNYDHSVENFIVNYWTKLANINVKCNIVEDLPLTKSGKHKFIINEDLH